MRTEQVWIIAHPDQERFFTLPRPPTKSHTDSLDKQGYRVFVTTVAFPPGFGVDADPMDVVEEVYLPIPCPVCDRVRLLFLPGSVTCEKCGTKWGKDGLSDEDIATAIERGNADRLGKDERTTAIVVNGDVIHVEGNWITYQEVVNLAGYEYLTPTVAVITSDRSFMGTMPPGERAKVVEGMIFNVAHTGGA